VCGAGKGSHYRRRDRIFQREGRAGRIWQNAQLNMQYGLFRVHGRIVQVRIYNLANVTFVQGDNGGIVLDAGSDFESTKAAC
jgi:alkyl sulfatase BDS1-like metallo-beta-lactamase superfamily hydrolase